jgi:hypothetical protein
MKTAGAGNAMLPVTRGRRKGDVAAEGLRPAGTNSKCPRGIDLWWVL